MYKNNVTQWMKEVEPYSRNPGKIDPARTALLIIDMEVYFASPSGHSFLPAVKDIIPGIKKLLEFFRERKLTVIYTAHHHKNPEEYGGMLIEWWGSYIKGGTDQAEICEELKNLPEERVLKKRRYSAFYQTELELVLKGKRIENLVITGVMTNLCCETTARDAFMRDFRVFFIADGNASASEEMHLSSLKNLAFGFAHVLTAEDMVGLLI